MGSIPDQTWLWGEISFQRNLKEGGEENTKERGYFRVTEQKAGLDKIAEKGP